MLLKFTDTYTDKEFEKLLLLSQEKEKEEKPSSTNTILQRASELGKGIYNTGTSVKGITNFITQGAIDATSFFTKTLTDAPKKEKPLREVKVFTETEYTPTENSDGTHVGEITVITEETNPGFTDSLNKMTNSAENFLGRLTKETLMNSEIDPTKIKPYDKYTKTMRDQIAVINTLNDPASMRKSGGKKSRQKSRKTRKHRKNK
jgi:hypothetical protein